MTDTTPDAATISEIIEMALSDHISFDLIRAQHGLGPDQVKVLMRTHLKPGSYRAWRKRVRTFSDRRALQIGVIRTRSFPDNRARCGCP
jgi:uncharacterized protein (TIGR03643 family)